MFCADKGERQTAKGERSTIHNAINLCNLSIFNLYLLFVVTKNCIQSYEHKMLLVSYLPFLRARLAHVIENIRCISSGKECAVMCHFLLQGTHISFYFVRDAANHPRGNSIACIRTKKRYQFILIHLHLRQFFRHPLKDSEAHFEARSDVTAEVFTFLRHEIVRNC